MYNNKIDIHGITYYNLNGAWVSTDTDIGTNVTIFPGAVLGRPPVLTNSIFREIESSDLHPLTIGDGCVIGANSVIYKGTTIGDGCLIGDTACIREQVTLGNDCIIAMGVTINYNTVVGNRTKVMNNTCLTGSMVIEEDVFIGSLVAFANDNSIGRDVAMSREPTIKGATVRRFVTIGHGACVLPGVEIGENAVIGQNSVVSKSVPPSVVAYGVPAKVVRALTDAEVQKAR